MGAPLPPGSAGWETHTERDRLRRAEKPGVGEGVGSWDPGGEKAHPS